VNKFLELIKAFGPGRLLAAGVATATVIAFLVVIASRLSAPSLGLLYSDLAIEDSGEIVSRLEALGTPYELKGNGSMIYVPEGDVLRLRMSMAEQGLPSGGSIGWELFDRTDSLGTTSFVQNINHLRALEGELARTIRTIDRVAAARVHLVLPRRELFTRESRQPSASIIIKLKGGALESKQVSAIQSLVAAAVPDLKVDQVSIVDDKGNLLSGRAEDEDSGGGLGFDKLRGDYEARLKEAIEALVERSVGIGNVRAEVSADMNFDRITTNAELYDPESQVARSTQTVEESNESSEGAEEQTVTVGNNLPENDGEANAGPQALTRSGRTEETINYEISRTVRTQVHESGTINRISVAVLVDGTYTTDAEGNRTYAPRNEEELQKIDALVRSSIGFDAERGDQIEVINMRFSRIEDDPDFVVDDGWLLTKHDYIRMAEIGALVLIALLIIMLVLRPLIGRLTREAPAAAPALPAPGNGGAAQLAAHPDQQQGQLAAPVDTTAIIKAVEAGEMAPEEAQAILAQQADEDDGETVNIAMIEGRVKASSTRKLVELIDRHPEEAVSILRSWMYQDA